MMNIQSYLKDIYRIVFLFVLMGFGTGIRAQNSIPINLYKSTQIIFNKNIKDVIVGTGDLQIKKTILGNVISLIGKAEKKDFVTTNLYVNTKEGYHYNFELVYADTAKNWTIPINEKEAIIKPSKKEEKKLENLTEIIPGTSNTNSTILKTLLSDKRRTKRYYKRFDDVYFRYVNHYYYNQFVYYKLEITNSSNQDYIIDFLKIFIDTKGKRGATKKSNTRKLLILNKDYTSIYGVNFVNPKETITIIFKFKKLSLNKEQKLTLELKEKSGNRDLNLNLKSRLVNNPYALKL